MNRTHPDAKTLSGVEGPFTFALFADPQLGMISSFSPPANGEKSIEEDELRFSSALAVVARIEPPPIFFAVLGDLIHDHPDMYDNCENLYSREIRAFKRLIVESPLQIPGLLLPGNHDVGNAPTPASIERYTNIFGPDYYSLNVGPHLLILVLNSGLLFDPSNALPQAEEQQAWLERTLRAAPPAQTKIILQHHPLWLDSADERDDLTSFSHVRGFKVSNAYFHVPTAVRARVVAAATDAGVAAVFSGHFHQNRVSVSRGVKMITTAATGEVLGPVEDGVCLAPREGPGFRLCKFIPPEGERGAKLETVYIETRGRAGTNKIRVPANGWGDLED